jgi:quercetin dioxygenase-like cupin family protein
MDIIRANAVPPLTPLPNGMSMRWLRGPAQDDTLDVGLVRFEPGTATPEHIHHRGQTLVIVSGVGFVSVAGVRTEVSPGDIVITPPGQPHIHGATDDQSMVHLSITTGRNDLVGDTGSYGSAMPQSPDEAPHQDDPQGRDEQP